MQYITITISVIALVISIMTFWLTRVRKGDIRMTRPTVIFLGPDGAFSNEKKIFVRTLLYSTSERGKYIQNMFIKLHRGENVQNFNIWVYNNNGLVRGSGLFVNRNGIASDHHFLMPKNVSKYDFLEGQYKVEIYIECVEEKPKIVFSQKLLITKEQAEEVEKENSGIYYDWAPNTQNYDSHISQAPKSDSDLSEFINKLT